MGIRITHKENIFYEQLLPMSFLVVFSFSWPSDISLYNNSLFCKKSGITFFSGPTLKLASKFDIPRYSKGAQDQATS